jgi:hypothetical protein
MLAGVGYKDTFRERLYGHPYVDTVRIHLLTLEDLFVESPAYQAARQDLPPLAGLAQLAGLSS